MQERKRGKESSLRYRKKLQSIGKRTEEDRKAKKDKSKNQFWITRQNSQLDSELTTVVFSIMRFQRMNELFALGCMKRTQNKLSS